MAAMVLMVIVLASFLQVESRLALSHAGYQRAKLNALASARIAIGHLQQTAGADQRVSMRADMYSANVDSPSGSTSPSVPTNPNSPQSVAHQKRYWTGIWATGGADSSKPRDWDVTNPHDSRLFLGWLTSPTAIDATDGELVDKTALNYYLPNRTNYDAGTSKVKGLPNSDGQKLIAALSSTLTGDTVRLVGGSAAVTGQPASGSIQWPAAATTPSLQEFYGAIDLPLMPLPGPALAGGSKLGANGRFAYWIGDEGLKAKVNLPDVYATKDNNNADFLPKLTDWDKGFAGTAAQRSSFESVTPSLNNAVAALMPAAFADNFSSLRNLDVISTITNGASWKDLGLPRARSRSEINAWASKTGGTAAGDALASTNRLLWHEITPWSYSVLSDTLNGGAKTDLSTAFELPYSVFRTLEMYPGQKDATLTTDATQRRQAFFHGAPNATFVSGLASELDYNRPNLMDKLGTAAEVLKAAPRSPEWAPRYLSKVSAISTTVSLMKTRNGDELPERLGFVYEVPLASNFFNAARIAANVQTDASGNAITANDVLTWPGLSSSHADNLTARIIRGPTWDLYRNHYRMYKREVEAAAAADSSALRGQGAPASETPSKALGFIARGVEPLTYATGLRDYPARRLEPPSTDVYYPPANPKVDNFFQGGGEAQNYFYRNNLADGNVGPDFLAQRRYKEPFHTSYKYTTTAPNYAVAGALWDGRSGRPDYSRYSAASDWRKSTDADYGKPLNPDLSYDYSDPTKVPRASTRTWPTSPTLAPTILRFSTIYSAVRSPTQIGMTVDPVVVIHNPYDVALEFEGLAMVTNGGSNPFRFIFRTTRTNFKSSERQFKQAPWDGTPPLVISSATIDLGDVVIGGGDNDNRSMSFRILPATGNVIRLEPGEIKVVGTAANPGNLNNSSNTNVSVRGDFGYRLDSRAFYKLTPFHNVRARMGSGSRNQNSERVLWTFDFSTCKAYAQYYNSTLGQLITWSNIGLDDKEYADRLYNLWEGAQSQRRTHDSMTKTDKDGNVIEYWDGTAHSLNSILGGGTISVLPRNYGWVSYNGYVVGTEGEILIHDPGPDKVFAGSDPDTGVDDDVITFEKKADYVPPVKRNGTVALTGNQSWNFYLLGRKSISGGATLDPDRRWFGTPDDKPSDYVPDPSNDPNETDQSKLRTIRKYGEGTQTAGGFNQVDESLLLNFQAMTSGWPLYGNGNSNSGYFTQVDLEWTRLAPFLKNPPKPNFYIEGSTGTRAPKDPEFNTDIGKGLELINSKADTMFNSNTASLGASSDKLEVVMIDFVRRSAEMTGETKDWYPTQMSSSGFGMKSSSPTSSRDSYGYDFKFTTPTEIRNAPTTPFFLSNRAQQAQLFGYDGKAHAPIGWVATERVLVSNSGQGSTADAKLAFSGDKAFWGPSIDDANGGKSTVILYSIPRRPLLSLSQLGNVAYAEKNTDADFTVGSSFAHPGIGDLTRIVEWPGPRDLFPEEKKAGVLPDDVKGPVPELGYVAKHIGNRPIRNRADVRTDHAFAANLSLWDTYYFSGLNLQANSFAHLDGTPSAWPSGGDLPIDADVAKAQKASLVMATSNAAFDPKSFATYKAALNDGKSLLANKRMVYVPDGKDSYTSNNLYKTTLKLPESEFPHPKYLARNSLYDGGFNVNSTSKAAWKAILAGMRNQALPDAVSATKNTTALTRFARAFKTPADNTVGTPGGKTLDPWNSYRELNDEEIDALAGAVVDEVKIRGPFMSLADFVNRRLINDDNFGLKGALQAAIDKAIVKSTGKTINALAIKAAGGSDLIKSDGTFAAPASVSLVDPTSDPNSHLWPTMYHDDWYSARGYLNWWREKSAYPKIPANKRFPSLRAMSETNDESKVTAALGAPGIVTQMDVLNSIGPNITARSDTFVVRSYGEALDDAGNVIGKAWVEVVVQRTTEYVAMTVGQKYPDYVEPNRRKLAYRVSAEYDTKAIPEMYEPAPAPNPSTAATAAEKTALLQEQRINRILGRRFRPAALRWLSTNEI